MGRQIVRQDDLRAAAALAVTLDLTIAHPFVGLVVVDDADELDAALAFNNFDHHNVDLTISVENPLSVGAVRDVARYVFGRLAAKRVTCTTLATNRRAIKRLENLGFGYEGRLRSRFPQGDGLVFGLLAFEQKFVRRSVEPAPSP